MDRPTKSPKGVKVVVSLRKPNKSQSFLKPMSQITQNFVCCRFFFFPCVYSALLNWTCQASLVTFALMILRLPVAPAALVDGGDGQAVLHLCMVTCCQAVAQNAWMLVCPSLPPDVHNEQRGSSHTCQGT